MLPLATQVRYAAFNAQDATFRLRGMTSPPSLGALEAEGRNANEEPGSITDARSRIKEALTYLKHLADDALDKGLTLPIALEFPGGIRFEMTGEQYARDWTLPQLYFHVVTTYAILRSCGVDIGKADYVPHARAYLKPPIMT